MNRLTGADLKVRDLLFQTLDTTIRKMRLPTGDTAVLVSSSHEDNFYWSSDYTRRGRGLVKVCLRVFFILSRRSLFT